jgi:hypothetical protein
MGEKLCPEPRVFFVVKVAGGNGGNDCMSLRPGLSGPQHGGDIYTHHFIATNRPYYTELDAMTVASKLCEETPGNRYYVVEATAGYLMPRSVKQLRLYGKKK